MTSPPDQTKRGGMTIPPRFVFAERGPMLGLTVRLNAGSATTHALKSVLVPAPGTRNS